MNTKSTPSGPERYAHLLRAPLASRIAMSEGRVLGEQPGALTAREARELSRQIISVAKRVGRA